MIYIYFFINKKIEILKVVFKKLNTNKQKLIKMSIVIKNKAYELIEVDNIDEISIAIYRYKFTEEFISYLFNFSKIHQYDDRKDFKEAWVKWTEEHEDIVNNENRRLSNLGYDGNVLDKMFKSARYYFRNKSTEKKPPKERRQYISIDRELLNAMDTHIKENMSDKEYKPKLGFSNFCEKHRDMLDDTINKMNVNDAELISDKIKKTYKNRYFMITTNKNK
jgi:hypothetical protein